MQPLKANAISFFIGVILTLAPTIFFFNSSEPESGIPNYNFSTEPPISDWNDKRLKRRSHEGDLDLAQRLTSTISASIYHCEFDEAPRLLENLVFLFKIPEFEQGHLALKSLRCGYCHQIAYILAKALLLQGIPAEVWGLNGHIVTLITIDQIRYIADPDFGIGPIKYEETTSNKTLKLYLDIVGDDTLWQEAVRKPLSSLDDDGRYYSMDELNEIEKSQERVILKLETTAYILMLLGLFVLATSIREFLDIRTQDIGTPKDCA